VPARADSAGKGEIPPVRPLQRSGESGSSRVLACAPDRSVGNTRLSFAPPRRIARRQRRHEQTVGGSRHRHPAL